MSQTKTHNQSAETRQKVGRTFLWFVVGFVSFAVVGCILGYFLDPSGPGAYSAPMVVMEVLLSLIGAGFVGWPFALYRHCRRPISRSYIIGVPMLFGLLFGPAMVLFAVHVIPNIVTFVSPEAAIMSPLEIFTVFAIFSIMGPIMMAIASAFTLGILGVALRGRFRVSSVD